MKRSLKSYGFTLIELMVVMVIIALLLSLVSPRYFHSVSRSKEAILKQNLSLIRDSLDKYYSDHGKYPGSLEELVGNKYLRQPPIDPVTGSTDTWVLISPPERETSGVYDVKSGAPGKASDGTDYKDW